MRSYRKVHSIRNASLKGSSPVCETTATGWASLPRTAQFFLIPAIPQTHSSSVETSVSYREIDVKNPLNPGISLSRSVVKPDATAFTARLSPPLNSTIPLRVSAASYRSATRLWRKRSLMRCYRRATATSIVRLRIAVQVGSRPLSVRWEQI